MRSSVDEILRQSDSSIRDFLEALAADNGGKVAHSDASADAMEVDEQAKSSEIRDNAKKLFEISFSGSDSDDRYDSSDPVASLPLSKNMVEQTLGAEVSDHLHSDHDARSDTTSDDGRAAANQLQQEALKAEYLANQPPTTVKESRFKTAGEFSDTFIKQED
jgi:hypothetical protein